MEAASGSGSGGPGYTEEGMRSGGDAAKTNNSGDCTLDDGRSKQLNKPRFDAHTQ